MGRKHCARRWWCRGQYHSSTQVAAESVASAMSVPSFSLFSDSQSLFSRNPSSSHVENTTENVELEGGKGNNINVSSVDETPYLSLPDTNSEPVIGGVPVTDKVKGKVVEDSELGGSRRESVPKTETQPIDVDCSDDSQLKKKKIGIAPKKCWDFLVPMDLDYKPKVDWDTNCHVIHQLKANLSKRQLRLFKKTCFGYFLDLPPVIVQIRVMHHLLIREVHHEVKNEMRFVVNDSRLRFGLGEFALVTGLKCKGDTSIQSIAENRLISKYFGTASVTFAQLADCFKKKKWETDDDALKIAVLYFLNSFLLSQLKTKTWLYECCPSLDGHFADHLGNKLPRILNWVVMGQIPNEQVALQMCSLQREQLKNITPTDDEKQLFDVRGLNFEIELGCTDSQPDSFQVFGTQLPKTQSMHESTGGDSQPINAEVMKELQALKLFVETKFEEVLAAIGRKPMKPEGNSAHKQQDNDPDFREMHNDYDQFESGHVGNDPVVLGDSTPKAPSISGFGGFGQDGGATGVNVKSVTASDGVVNDDFGLDSNFKLSASTIDQITTITQQATYKQSSHDVKKSGPAPLPSGIPVQTQADVVIESNTAPQGTIDADNVFMCSTCRVDGVGQVDVGGSNVNLPSGGRRNVNQSGNELTTRAVNKSKPDQSVSRIGGSSKVIKGRFPFVNDISETVDFKLTTAFSNFVEANMQLGEEVYLPGDQKLEPCFDFEVEQIDDKTFFHTLNYSGRPLSSSHLIIIFYYLRKKVFTEFVKGGKHDHLIDRSDNIMEYMKRFRMHCNTPWHQVDRVIFPINLAEIWHWILGCVSFHKRYFYVYDSLRSRNHKKAIQKVAEAYAVLIPLFLVSIEFYNQRSDIVVENGLHMGKKLTDPYEIELITDLPTQQNSDCRVYVACFAEYIIEDLPIHVANFDVDGLRARFGILLWHYGRNKQLHGESSESEAPVAPKKTRGKKRKK
ncbi:uncharacterized protein [Nicotiana sylvestris]|uniref:uncharacterized protein n=1 Tax=Nicotiana sylvestris TaxID=4096 RepID=UPI00388C7476